MIITGHNLLRVSEGLELALAELHNQIATCPDVIAYEDDIRALEIEMLKIRELKARVDNSIAKEKRHYNV